MRQTDIVIEHAALKALVGTLLEHPQPVLREWTLQGLGMLRTYLDAEKTVRLHVWDDRYAVPEVSELHTHPWDMVSVVVAGQVANQIYLPVPPGNGAPFFEQEIICGEGGGTRGKPRAVSLYLPEPDVYLEGEKYAQRFDAIHSSHPSRGTVTMVTRSVPRGGNPDIASVFWPEALHADGWVSAEPRKATQEEVIDITQYALDTWF